MLALSTLKAIDMLTAATLTRYPPCLEPRTEKPYHHGNLEKALLQAAAKLIDEQGVGALTLRGVGQRVGVSRTALYRHFEDKAGLLARLAAEGFADLRRALQAALYTAVKRGRDPLELMAGAYVKYAVDNPAHYRVMFGHFIGGWERYPALVTEAEAAVSLLTNTIVTEQAKQRLSAGDPVSLGQVIWSVLHGIAALGIDGLLAHKSDGETELENLARFAMQSFKKGLNIRQAAG